MRALADLLICLRFFSRLPVPTTARETELGARGFAAAAAMVPLAGAIVGLIPASVLIVTSGLHVPPLPAAALAIAALVSVTGALHEDALADCADGFGGGATRDRKLEIMRDSRIGAFGACAIVLSLLIRTAAASSVLAHGLWLGAFALVVAAGASRTACLLPLRLLPPARPDGLGAAAGRPSNVSLAIAGALAIGLGLLLLPLGIGIARMAVVGALAVAAASIVSVIAARQIQGQTGDVIGAAQQVAECVALTVLAAGP